VLPHQSHIDLNDLIFYYLYPAKKNKNLLIQQCFSNYLFDDKIIEKYLKKTGNKFVAILTKQYKSKTKR